MSRHGGASPASAVAASPSGFEIANADGDADRAAEFCGELTPGQRPRCFTGLGTILVTLFPAEAERRRACAKAAGRLAPACEKGAAVTRD